VRHPWLHWKTWLEVEHIADLRPAGTLSFSGFEQIIPAAVAGHGVALGRSPLVKTLLDSGELVAPFKSQADPARAYFAIVAKSAASRPEVADFVEWLELEAAKR
jgi:LysR family transcriptional regulator, glycine cleavage system transcriptional activator